MPNVLYEKRKDIAWITLNRPQAMNALDDGLNDALRLEKFFAAPRPPKEPQ